MAFTIRQLQFFVAAAEQGSVTGAARALSISQSSVTEAIRALETLLALNGIGISPLDDKFLKVTALALTGVAATSANAATPNGKAKGYTSVTLTADAAAAILQDFMDDRGWRKSARRRHGQFHVAILN